MSDSERTVELHKAIEAHLEAHGPKQWGRLQEAFPDISKATFWRHVRLIRERKGEQSEGPARAKFGSTSNVNPNADRLEHQMFSKDGTDFRNLEDFYADLRLVARYHDLMVDAENLTNQCVDRRGKITKPTVYLKSLAMRQRLMEYQDAALTQFCHHERQMEFYQAILNTMTKLSRAVGAVGMQMLREDLERLGVPPSKRAALNGEPEAELGPNPAG